METTSRVREILSWYPSDNPGTVTNIYRLLMHGRLAGTGKLVILPVDQGFEHGPARSFAPNPPAYDPEYHVQLAIDAGCNAYAAPLGFIEAIAGKFAGQIPLILSNNNSDTLSKGIPGERGHREREGRRPAGRRDRLHDLSGPPPATTSTRT
jgi:class I fructose-bisphosphate aldolase